MNVEEALGKTLLHIACDKGYLKFAQYFVKKGLSLDTVSKHERTLLHSAVRSGNTALVQYLIESNKIDINARDKEYGNTALHNASKNGQTELVKLLIKNGASLLVQNKQKQMPYDIAMMRRDFGADPEQLKDTKVELMLKIRAMHDYGELLKSQGVAKG